MEKSLCENCEHWYGQLNGPMENCWPEQCNMPGGDGMCAEMAQVLYEPVPSNKGQVE
jgi:hypothetical protein